MAHAQAQKTPPPPLLLLDPIPAYALWAASYPPQAHNPLMRAEERAMLSLLPADLSGANVLDVGCGSGRYILHARRRGARQIIGADLSVEMLAQAAMAERQDNAAFRPCLLRADMARLPLVSGWADVTVCALTLGHAPDLAAALSELRRVTRPGGLVLCSDFHPLGAALGWKRDFKVGDSRFAVRHATHYYEDWHAACQKLGLAVLTIREPRLDPADIPEGATFDPRAREAPVALALALRREGKAKP